MAAARGSTSGFAHAFANLLKTMVGGGLLTLPYVTARAGLGLSLVGLAILAMLTQAAIRLLVRCVVQERQAIAAYKDLEDKRGSGAPSSAGHGGSSWRLVSIAAFGRCGWYVTLFSLLASQLGVVASYLDFVGNALMAFLGLSALSSRLLLWSVLTTMCMLRVLKSVSLLSMAALVVYAYIVVLIGYFGAAAIAGRDPAAPAAQPLLWLDLSEFGAWFGPSLFAFEGMGTALSIFESMGASDARPFLRVVSSAYVVATLVYGGVAAWGYIAWGAGVGSVVLQSFPHTPLGVSSQLMLALVLLLSGPIQLTTVLQVFEAAMEPHPALARLWPLERALVVGLCTTASYILPDMEAMVGLTGAFGFSMIGFILPGLFFLRLRPPNPAAPAAGVQCGDVLLAVAMVTLGIFGGVWGIATELSKVSA